MEGGAHRRLEVKALSWRGRQTGSGGHVGKWLIWLVDAPTRLPIKNVAFLWSSSTSQYASCLITSLKFPFHWVPGCRKNSLFPLTGMVTPLTSPKMGSGYKSSWRLQVGGPRLLIYQQDAQLAFCSAKLLPCFLWEKHIFSLWAKSNFRCSDIRFFTLIHAG